MKNSLFIKIKEALFSVLPISFIVVILQFTPLINLTDQEVIVFCISVIFLILGIALFNLGADIAMQPIGEQIGSSLMKTKKLSIILPVCLIIGILITIAEPDLSVLAMQVQDVINSSLLIASIGIGVGIFLVIAVTKIIFKKDLSTLLMFFYMILFALVSLIVINGKGNLIALSFDSGGVTTGPITVPFIMTLGIGIAATIGGRHASENSFGLISLCSVGPILAILILGLFTNGTLTYSVPNYGIADNIALSFLETSLSTMKEVGVSLSLIVIFFIIIQCIYLKLPRKKLIQIFIGIIYTFVGLVLFLTAATVGFLPIGFKMGQQIATDNNQLVILFGFILGLVVVLAEPAIHVLTKQVEEITNGGVTKRSMLIALSIGVGVSIGLSMIRIVYDFSILYFIIPGYFISLGLSFFVPKLYTAIAFDSGGVASGPLTSSFILPFAIGVCLTIQGEANVLTDAFGIIAMVAMTPLISIQTLGFKAIMLSRIHEKQRMKQILASDDEQIIYFD